ncbi:MAG: ribbon-helix-helix protein, CopG family [Planctomycetota bacterium]|jgi:hypothetical protein
MRTTLTLDDDLARELRERARRTGAPFKRVVNEALRRGLSLGSRPDPKPPAFVVQPHRGGFRAGVDPLKLNQLVDELEIQEFELLRSRENDEP